MTHIHLATALVRRDGAVLLVASRYRNQPRPLWNLPGGRQQEGELLSVTVLRELREETSLIGTIRRLCYVSESYDAQNHFINVTFEVDAAGTIRAPRRDEDHVVDAAWTPLALVGERLTVAVVREPLLAFLAGASTRYTGYADAGISIDFFD